MTTVVTSSYFLTPSLMRHSKGMRDSLQQATQEMATGVTGDIGKRLRGDFFPINSLENNLSKIGSYKNNITLTSLAADTMQSVISTIATRADTLSNQLMATNSLTTPALFSASLVTGKVSFEGAISALNTSVSGRYVFSGMVSDQPPFPPSDVILAALEAALPNSTDPAVLSSAISDWFMQPGGLDTLYQGGNSKSSVAVTSDDSVRLDITALDPALRESLVGMGTIALLEKGFLASDTSAQMELAKFSLSSLLETSDSRIYLAGKVGSVQQQLKEALVRNSAEETTLNLAKVNLLEADIYETSVKIEDLETRLDAFYLLTSRLSKLRLSEYI